MTQQSYSNNSNDLRPLNNPVSSDKLLSKRGLAMLENISFIASVICALTAITTSLRAVGTAREYYRQSSESKLKSGCRINDYCMKAPSSQRSSLKLHFVVTVIWLLLSVIFIIPMLIQQGDGGADRPVTVFVIPFALLIIVLCLIWRKVLRLKG